MTACRRGAPDNGHVTPSSRINCWDKPKGGRRMGRIVKTALALTLLLLLLPLLLVFRPAESGETQMQGQSVSDATNGGSKLRILINGKVQEMDLEDYIWGVVAAEMPASFQEEALKAQAVAARTYALNKASGVTKEHPDAQLCDNPACCQAYISPEQAKENWGDNAKANQKKITEAIKATEGQVILYQGKLIDAVFFSSAAGATLDAVEVWGGSVPYLVSVDSPEGEEVPGYHTEVSYTADEFRTVFQKEYPNADLQGKPSSWFGDVVRTSAGSVGSIEVGGVSVKGTVMRTLFSLRSSVFTVEATDTAVTFHVTGNGHGVGMSQYGANELAKEGKNYKDILKWYYTGVTVEKYSGKSAKP